jgi:hypothetical protein
MESSIVDTIITNLENQLYSRDGDIDSKWGIGWILDPSIPDTLFHMSPRLTRSLFLAKTYNNDDYSTPQFILNYKRGYWVIVFEFYSKDHTLNQMISLKELISASEVRHILSKILNLGIILYDFDNNNIIENY